MISCEAFAKLMEKCFAGRSIPNAIAIALSGGVDLFCLTYLLNKYRKTHRPDMSITAITIDHLYRDGSKEEARNVGEIVKHWGINHVVESLQYDTPVRNINNFEEVARTKRYEKFQDICHQLQCDALFVGHNLNDQLETFLQRLQQNSSLFGLRGLHTVGLLPLAAKGPITYIPPVNIYRPLLLFERSEIEDTCIRNNIKWFEDHSNKDIQLTKRNFLRHLINDVIPARLSQPNNQELACISKEEITSTYNQVMSLTDMYQEQIDHMRANLEQAGKIILIPQNGSISIQISHDIFRQTEQTVFARFLYQLLSPISSVKHYHWSYAKLERQAIPNIFDFYSKEYKKKLKLTYLNVLFDITKFDEYIDFNLSRQPISRDDLNNIITSVTVSKDWSNWVLFDRRYWLRLRSTTLDQFSLNIVPFNEKSHKHQVLEMMNFSEEEKTNTSRFLSVPVIECNGEVLSLPTYELYRNNDIEVEWCLKAGF